jgi:hypothetical protein
MDEQPDPGRYEIPTRPLPLPGTVTKLKRLVAGFAAYTAKIIS